MENSTQNMLVMWAEARTRFSDQLAGLTETDLPKKLDGSPNSAGFIIRHVADVELLFTKNVFGHKDLKVSAKTVMQGKDTGEWTNLKDLLAYQQQAFDSLAGIIQHQTDADWSGTVTTREFGSKTKSEALGRIVSHTAYHAGQLALILKYVQ